MLQTKQGETGRNGGRMGGGMYLGESWEGSSHRTYESDDDHYDGDDDDDDWKGDDKVDNDDVHRNPPHYHHS